MHHRVGQAVLGAGRPAPAAPRLPAAAAMAAGGPDLPGPDLPGLDPQTPAPARVSRFERRAMGSPLRLTVVGVAPDRARRAWEATSRLIEEIEQALSRFRESSDLVALNVRAGDPLAQPVNPFLYRAVSAAHRAWWLTAGAFDPRVIGDLERLGYAGVPLPENGPLLPAPGSFPVGEWLIRNPRELGIAISRPIDLGGIGKGLALRWAFAALVRMLPEIPMPLATGQRNEEQRPARAGALLEAGGDIIASGAAPDPGPWMIGIEHPNTGEEIAAVAVESGAICTSSIAVHRWSNPDGRIVHHLVDPRTGEPGGEGLASVTVAGPDPAWAEVWTKSLFLAGARGIGGIARSLGLEAWWVLEDGSVEMTPAGRMATAWLAGEE
jgi:thiamine biosynthesis lipoprotein